MFLCALCALFINLFLPSVPTAIPHDHIIVLIAIILSVAFIIAYYNGKLIMKDASEKPPPQEQPLLASETLPAGGAADLKASAPAAPPVVKPPAVKKREAARPQPSEPAADWAAESARLEAARSIEEDKEIAVSFETAVDAALGDLMACAGNMPKKPAAAPARPLPARSAQSAKSPKPAARRKDTPPKADAPSPNHPSFNAEQAAPADSRGVISPESLSKMGALDEILEYAAEQDRRQNYKNSILALTHALNLYETNDYAPFIAIELGNIYKNTGLYDKAIVIYNKAFALPTVTTDPAMQKEFQKNISYVRIVKEILRRHNQEDLPFSKIPAAMMQEIENEFAIWHSQQYAS